MYACMYNLCMYALLLCTFVWMYVYIYVCMYICICVYVYVSPVYIAFTCEDNRK